MSAQDLELDVEGAIRAAAERCSNWGRWGPDDRVGTLNFITPATRLLARDCIRTGVTFSLAMGYDSSGPQIAGAGFGARHNPIHVMSRTGVDAEHGLHPRPHGFGSADDLVTMFLQSGTQWDGLGHVFDHGAAWNGRPASIVSASGDSVTGIEHMAPRVVGRAVLLDIARTLGVDSLAPGLAIDANLLDRTIEEQGETSQIRTGDIVLVRTGYLGECRARGWGDFAGGDAPGLSFGVVDWLHEHEIAALATDTWGVEVRPNEFANAFQPLHQVVIPHLGLVLGEMFDLDEMAAYAAQERRYETFFTGGPLPITGAVGSPLNPLCVF